MVKVKTIEILQQSLDDELAWRKKELAIIKSFLPVKSSTKVPATEFVNCHIRSGIALLYAHWEGFVKAAGNFYLEYIISQKLQYAELANNFVALAAKRFLSDFTVVNKVTAHVSVTEFFLSGLTDRCSYLAEIETKSNLSSDVFKEIILMLGLDYKEYAPKANLIDETLLKNRNYIAHGNYLLVDVDTFMVLHGTIIGLMSLFATQISNAASTQSYKRVPDSPVRVHF